MAKVARKLPSNLWLRLEPPHIKLCREPAPPDFFVLNLMLMFIILSLELTGVNYVLIIPLLGKDNIFASVNLGS